MVRSLAVTRARWATGALLVCLSACAPETDAAPGNPGMASSSSVTSPTAGLGASAAGTAGARVPSVGMGAAGAAGAGTLQTTQSATGAGGTPSTPTSNGAAGAGSRIPTGFAGRTASAGSGSLGIDGNAGAAGAGATSGTGSAGTAAGSAGMSASGTAGSGSASSNAGDGETGRLVGMTAAHNVVRARIMNPTPDPPLPPLKWSTEVAEVAQAYADKLATDCSFQHSGTRGLGENLAYYEGFMASPEDAVEGWAGEEECYTFGPLMAGDNCDMACTARQSSNGCGHYTQVVWRNTTEVGCGVASCSGARPREIWVCNYKAPGNYVGMEPY